MVSGNRILITLTTFVAMSSYASAFWFSSEEPKQSPRLFYQQPYQQPDYYRQYVPPPLPYVPLQVPLPAHLAPATVQNVQLVPCLCPVSQEYSYENSQDYVTRKTAYGQPQVVSQQKRRR